MATYPYTPEVEFLRPLFEAKGWAVAAYRRGRDGSEEFRFVDAEGDSFTLRLADCANHYVGVWRADRAKRIDLFGRDGWLAVAVRLGYPRGIVLQCSIGVRSGTYAWRDSILRAAEVAADA